MKKIIFSIFIVFILFSVIGVTSVGVEKSDYENIEKDSAERIRCVDIGVDYGAFDGGGDAHRIGLSGR